MSDWNGQSLADAANNIPLLDRPLEDDGELPRDRLPPIHIRRKPIPYPSAVSGIFNSAPSSHDPAPVTTSTYLRLPDEDITESIENVGREHRKGDTKRSSNTLTEHLHRARRSECHWLPHMLRWHCLLTLLLFTLAILATLISLHLKSRNSRGLGDDDGESIQFFGWRFVPTLIAVLYALMCTMLLDDVKRTEAFARLAKVNGASANVTVLHQPGAWWDAFADGFSTTKNGGSRSWPLICSATCFFLASLVISPFSSAFLQSDEVTITTKSSFNRIEPGQQFPLTFGDQIIPRFRTISNMLQNVTTSAWVTDQSVVLPVYPSYYSSMPLGATLGTSSEVWHTEATVIITDLHCKSLHLTAKDWRNLTNSFNSNGIIYNQSVPIRSVKLVTDEECAINLTISDGSPFARYGGISWARHGVFALLISNSDTYTPVTEYDALQSSSDPLMDIRVSQGCLADEILLVSNIWPNSSSDYSGGSAWDPDLQVGGQICNANYSVANVIVKVNITDGDSIVEFDSAELVRRQRQIDSSTDLIDTSRFQEDFLTSNWSYHLVSPNSQTRMASEGPAAAIAATYDFSITNVLNSTTLISQAVRMKQRYLGEAIMSALSQWDGPVSREVDGQLTLIQNRIYVVESVAYVLEAVVLVELLLVTALYFLTRLERRPLCISSDPAKTTTIAKLIAHDPTTCHQFKPILTASLKDPSEELKNSSFRTSLNRLSIVRTESLRHADDESPPAPSKPKDWRPLVLYRWTKIGLATLLAIVLVAIAVLFKFSTGLGLYEKAFVYEIHVKISSEQISTIAPYSIIPTLVAVGVGLWWGATETELRFLQPFITMTRRPTVFADGVDLSYQSSYLIWAGLKAATHKHWLLSIVSTGAFLSQICMSALWKEEYGYRNSPTYLQRDLELRVLPNLIESTYTTGTHAFSAADTAAIALANLYGSLKTNWLYSGIIEMSLNGTEPSWSSDGWSFVEMNLILPDRTADQLYQTNITVMTPAIRAELHCSPYDDSLSDPTNWLTAQDFTNSSVWNVTNNSPNLTTGYTFGCGGLSGHMIVQANTTANWTCAYETYTSVFAHNLGIECCDNITAGGVGDAVIAYWSPNYGDAAQNFTVKWIYGQPVGGVQMVNVTDRSYLAWSEAPKVTALNCKPVVQKANASVTVDGRSGRVQSYSILDTIQDDENAWLDDFDLHTYWTPNGFANITVSHGSLFVKALLAAADLSNLAGDADDYQYDPTYPRVNENLGDVTFNFRQLGLNMDYMSYSMYSMANRDRQALLDPSKLSYYANKTFSTFFQHYASSNTTFQNGGWVYQPIGSTLPPNSTSQAVANLTYSAGSKNTVEALLSTRVKMLRMSPLAAWLCMSILLWLIITMILFVLVEGRYFATMRSGITTIADIAILIAGSQSFLSYVRKKDLGHGDDGLDRANLRTRLGWFRDQEGHERWGIELLGDEHEVEWLDGKSWNSEVKTKKRPAGNRSDHAESLPMVRLDREAGLRNRGGY